MRPNSPPPPNHFAPVDRATPEPARAPTEDEVASATLLQLSESTSKGAPDAPSALGGSAKRQRSNSVQSVPRAPKRAIAPPPRAVKRQRATVVQSVPKAPADAMGLPSRVFSKIAALENALKVNDLQALAHSVKHARLSEGLLQTLACHAASSGNAEAARLFLSGSKDPATAWQWALHQTIILNRGQTFADLNADADKVRAGLLHGDGVSLQTAVQYDRQALFMTALAAAAPLTQSHWKGLVTAALKYSRAGMLENILTKLTEAVNAPESSLPKGVFTWLLDDDVLEASVGAGDIASLRALHLRGDELGNSPADNARVAEHISKVVATDTEVLNHGLALWSCIDKSVDALTEVLKTPSKDMFERFGPDFMLQAAASGRGDLIKELVASGNIEATTMTALIASDPYHLVLNTLCCGDKETYDLVASYCTPDLLAFKNTALTDSFDGYESHGLALMGSITNPSVTGTAPASSPASDKAVSATPERSSTPAPERAAAPVGAAVPRPDSTEQIALLTAQNVSLRHQVRELQTTVQARNATVSELQAQLKTKIEALQETFDRSGQA
jgi:hypothetical protein